MDTTEVTVAIERARRGDPDGLTGLYQAFGRRVLGLCRHLLGSPEAAEDARSEVFARLPRAIERYDPVLPFDRWLLSVTSHHCLDLLRRRRVESRLFVAELPETDSAAVGDAPGAAPLAAGLADGGRGRGRADPSSGALPDRAGAPLRRGARLRRDRARARRDEEPCGDPDLPGQAGASPAARGSRREGVTMTCLSELTCAVYVDGELSSGEARAAQRHLGECARCRELVAALRDENRVLSAALDELSPSMGATMPATILRAGRVATNGRHGSPWG